MLVFVLIVIACLTAIPARRDDRFSACLHEGLNERIGVIGFVGGDGLRGNTLDQVVRLRDVMDLPGGELPARQVAQPFDQRVNLGRQSATRAADRLAAVFFGAPAACW